MKPTICKVLLTGMVVALSVAVLRADSLSLNFRSSVSGTIQDGSGQGTGLSARLPGTGGSLPIKDPDLSLNTGAGQLTVTSTNSDINGQFQLSTGEYLGTSLASLGFATNDNFIVSASFSDVQYSEKFDQFGLFVGTDSSHVFRGGWLFFFNGQDAYTVSNNGGVDFNTDVSSTLAPSVGDEIVLTLERTNGLYSYQIEDLTHPGISGLIPLIQPSYLNGASNLYVGIYAANARNADSKSMVVDRYSVDVTTVPEPSSLMLLGLGSALLWFCSWHTRNRRSLA